MPLRPRIQAVKSPQSRFSLQFTKPTRTKAYKDINIVRQSDTEWHIIIMKFFDGFAIQRLLRLLIAYKRHEKYLKPPNRDAAKALGRGGDANGTKRRRRRRKADLLAGAWEILHILHLTDLALRSVQAQFC